jgi:glutathione synthase/RimK-type ligase-like ATP-grasp enzyme|tara:strand:+ start:4130 stop:4390 length:261 start_codon:yes stop_codon:yes gene_type:complete
MHIEKEKKMIVNSKEKIRQLETKVKELEDSLSEEVGVKKSEIVMNRELKQRIERQDLVIKTLHELNEKFLNKIADLKIKLKKLMDE